MPINTQKQIIAYLSILHTILSHLKDGTNPSLVREVLGSTKLKDIDQFVNETRKTGQVDGKAFDDEVNKAWAACSEEEGGAVPDESQSDAAAVKKRIIHLEALQKTYNE